MSADVMVLLGITGAVAVALAIIVVLALPAMRRRVDTSRGLEGQDPELARGLRETQEQIERGQRGY
jgi:hypothetical protein